MVEYVSSARAGVRARAQDREGVATVVRRLDWLLVLAIGSLVLYGLWAIYGITRHIVPGNESYYVVRQSIFASIGLLSFVAAIFVNPALYRRFHLQLYWLTIGLMALVFIAAPLTRGSRRWIELGFFRFQPSEFGKLLFVLALAGFLADRIKRVGEPGTTTRLLALASLPIGLVFLQPDIGTALVYGAALVAVLFVAGTRWTQLALLGVGAFVCAVAVLWALPAAGIDVLKPYQRDRIVGFTNPDSDPGGTTYNLHQSKTAVGAGGVRGRGVEGATQTKYDYVPEHETDFVFASLAEQRGFVGASLLLGLYLLVVWRGLRVAAMARDAFSAIVAGGIVLAFLFQVFINVGMTMGIAPITGIPLPFVSVGGSSMIANFAAMGILLAIRTRGRER